MQVTNSWQRPLENPLPLATPAAMPELDPAPAPTGIGGWLILPAFALVCALGLGAGALADLRGQFAQADGAALTALEVQLYATGIYTILLATLLHSFFRRERWVPRGIIVLVWLNAVGGVLVGYADGTLSGIQMGHILAAILWTAYFLSSKRVKATFIQ